MSRPPATLLLTVMLCLFGTAAPATSAQWAQHDRDGLIEVFSEFKTDTRPMLAELREVADELQSALEIPAPTQSIQVVLFASSRSYRAYLANRIPEGVQRKAIFYSNGDVFQIYAFRSPNLMTDLRHEFTHALLHQRLPWLPLWIDEGLAEYFEEAPAARDTSTRLAGIKWKSRMGWAPDLGRLERLPSASDMDAADYRDSWTWIHFLMHDSPASRKLLKSYLLAISAGEAPGQFSDWAASRESLVLKRVGSYFRRFQISLR